MLVLGLFPPHNAAAAPPPSGSWPQQGFSPRLNLDNRYETLLGPSNVQDLTPAWEAEDDINDYEIENGLVYMSDADTGAEVALDASSGAVVWSNSSVSAGSAAVANGLVYVSDDSAPTDSVDALDATTGTTQWTFTPGSKCGGFENPTVTDGTVYVGCGAGSIFALNAETGAEIWRHAFTGDLRSQVAVADGVMYADSALGSQDYLFALDAKTGATDWSYEAKSTRGFGRVGIANRMVYFFNGTSEMALNDSDGSVVWTHKLRAAGFAQAVARRTVFVASFQSTSLYALNAFTGKKRWKTDLGSGVGAPPSVANGVIYVVTANGLFAVSASSGAVLWQGLTDGGAFGEPEVADGSLYVVNGNFDLEALTLPGDDR